MTESLDLLFETVDKVEIAGVSDSLTMMAAEEGPVSTSLFCLLCNVDVSLPVPMEGVPQTTPTLVMVSATVPEVKPVGETPHSSTGPPGNPDVTADANDEPQAGETLKTGADEMETQVSSVNNHEQVRNHGYRMVH